jgi:hypothetical protein
MAQVLHWKQLQLVNWSKNILVLWNLAVPRRGHNTTPLDPILGHVNALNTKVLPQTQWIFYNHWTLLHNRHLTRHICAT